MSYKQDVRDELYEQQNSRLKFRDNFGFVIGLDDTTPDALGDETPNTLGEGTYHTAITAIAVATGNYSQDDWEKNTGNTFLSELLRTLLDKAWGNKDSLGRVHPIRHPDEYDFNRNGDKIRCRPLSKDSFGPIIAAIYFAYKCPNSNEEVRLLSRELATKWADYLVLFQWTLHSIYFEGEFDQDGNHYRNIFDKHHNPNSYLGPGAFALLPNEIYAFQNVASAIGIPAVTWNPWINLSIEFKSTMKDYVAPYVGDLSGRAVKLLLEQLNLSIPIDIPLGADDWNMGKIRWKFEINFPSNIQERIVKKVSSVTTDAIREAYRLDTYRREQDIDLLGLVLNKILDIFPQVLTQDTWRTVLTDAIQKVIPWLLGSIWVEAGTFLGALSLLSTRKPSDISYTCWSFIVECETRVEIREFLRVAIKGFYDKIAADDNPNGLWAWLAEDLNVVKAQQQLFESKGRRYWKEFAYGPTKYNEWAQRTDASTNQKKSPRVDYLVIDSLLEKGPPAGMAEIVEDWYEKVKDIIDQIINNVVQKVKNQFNDFGSFSLEKLDEAGQMIRETWNKSMEYAVEILKEGTVIDKRVFDKAGQALSHWAEQNGERLEEYWNRASKKYWKATWRKIADGYDIISRSITSIEDIITDEYWNRGAEKYLKETKKIVADVSSMLSRVIISSEDLLTEEYWNRASEKYWKGTWKKIADGYDMISRSITSIADILTEEYWNRGAQKYLKETWKKIIGDLKIIERITIFDDKAIKEIWNEAGEWGKSVFDKAGNLIERSGVLDPGFDLPDWIPELPINTQPVDIPRIRW